MAFAIDMSNLDIYSAVFGLLGVQTTGDPVNDAIYLLLLPLIVLYMYSDFVITRSRFFGQHGKFRYLLMLIVGYVIIQRGFFALFAAWSLPLLGIIMVWHAGSFIFGWGQAKDQNSRNVGYQPDEDSRGSGGIMDVAKGVIRAPSEANRKLQKFEHDASELVTTDAPKKAKAQLERLEKMYIECDKSRLNSIRKGEDVRGINQTIAQISTDATREIAYGRLMNNEVKKHAPNLARAMGIH